MPRIALAFHPAIALVVFLLTWASTVTPAWVAAKRELRDKPASPLLPKPPAKGSKICLERITPLWNRMSFTYKVTARNLFRYKARMFMTSGGYKHVFGEQYQSNAYMVRLKNHETSNVESRSAKLIKLDGAKGIVQNTTSKKQVATIVDLPDQIMEVLILAAELLAVVILYNLTNLNVSERIRELPTIKVLGGLGVLVYRRLKTVDMLGALKSVE